MDQDSLPEDVLEMLRQGCGMEPSNKLKAMVARFLRFKHAISSGPVTVDVLAMLAAVASDVKADKNAPKNPFADTLWGTPLTVLRMDSKEVLCNGFWMGVGEGLTAHLVKVAMHDNEQEAQDFDYRQVRLRDEMPAQPVLKETGPIKVIPDPVEIDEAEEQEANNGLPDAVANQPQLAADENSEVDIEDTSIPPEAVEASQWANIGKGSLVWMEDGSDGEFLGIDSVTGFLRIRVEGRHKGEQSSLYTADQVRLAEAIPVEHDPVAIEAR